MIGATINGFSDLDGDTRLFCRRVIEVFNGKIRGYSGDGLTIAMPNGMNDRAAIVTLLEKHGFRVTDMTYFPIVDNTDPAEIRHRHNQPLTDPPGYNFFWRFDPC